MIPQELMGNYWALSGVPQGIDVIQVKHVSGGWSTIGFKNYEQPTNAFYGTDLDWIWLDEECPQDIYNECLIRTMTTNGIVFNTFTPLKGLTPQVVRFLEQADYLAGAQKILSLPSMQQDEDGEDARIAHIRTKKAVIQAGWDDAPWLTEESKEAMLADTPPHLRDARRIGTPAMGSGNVYPISLESMLVTPFQIPPYYKRMYALDVGWNKTAVLWAALDPQTNILYITDEHYLGEEPPPIHAAAIRARGTWIPGVIDPASRGRTQNDGTQLIQHYKDLGLNIRPAKNAVDSGIHGLWQRMSTGNLKVFNNLTNFAKEFVLYRRDERGKIIKENDHLMDCFDKTTEVLTESGWKAWPDVSEDDIFATVNLDTDTIEYQKPYELIRKEYEGPMIFLDNKAQQMVTPTHRMVVYQRNDNYQKPVIRLAQDLKIWDKIKISAANWEGEEFVPPIDGCSPEDFAETLGWWMAEGSLNHPYECNPYRFGVIISQCKYPHKEYLRELLDRMPQSWYETDTGFECTHKALYNYLQQFGLSRDKFVPDEIKKANKSVIEAFLRGYFYGDGWDQGKGKASASISKQLTDDVQELMFKVGRPGNVLLRKTGTWSIDGRSGIAQDQWWFVESTTKTAMLRDSTNKSNVREQHYDGIVYCASVPNGTLVVRRNGKISVSGNCFRYIENNIERAKSLEQLKNRPSYDGGPRYNI